MTNYLFGILVFVGLLVASYFKGQSSLKRDLEAKENRQRINDLKKSERIKDEVNKTTNGDLDSKLSKWMRD